MAGAVDSGASAAPAASYLPSDQYRPFSNGSEFEHWLGHNCRRGRGGCRNYKPEATSSRHGCPIEVALAKACVGEGTIKAATALRGGFLVEGDRGRLVRPEPWDWRCPEYRGYDEPDDRPRRGPRPPADQMDLLDPRNVETPIDRVLESA